MLMQSLDLVHGQRLTAAEATSRPDIGASA
jgi:hypothetical protein